MAVSLAGTTEAINIPGGIAATKSRTKMTACYWIKLNSAAAASVTMFAYSIGTASATTSRFGCQWVAGTPGSPRGTARGNDADAQAQLQSGTTLSTGVWYFIVVVVDYGASTGKLYINGALDTSGALAGGPIATSTQNTNSDDGRIGGRANSATEGVDGKIEGFRLYNGELTANPVKTLYTSKNRNTVQLDQQQHHFPLVEGAPATTVSSIGCKNKGPGEIINGTNVGAPTFQIGNNTWPRRRLAA
jgi:hypothetical protein